MAAAARMYQSGPSTAEITAMGLTEADVEPPADVDLWPENAQPVAVFLSARTQWRVGMGGPTGLDYNALPALMRLLEVPKKERADVFAAVQVLERSALTEMNRSNR